MSYARRRLGLVTITESGGTADTVAELASGKFKYLDGNPYVTGNPDVDLYESYFGNLLIPDSTYASGFRYDPRYVPYSKWLTMTDAQRDAAVVGIAPVDISAALAQFYHMPPPPPPPPPAVDQGGSGGGPPIIPPGPPQIKPPAIDQGGGGGGGGNGGGIVIGEGNPPVLPTTMVPVTPLTPSIVTPAPVITAADDGTVTAAPAPEAGTSSVPTWAWILGGLTAASLLFGRRRS